MRKLKAIFTILFSRNWMLLTPEFKTRNVVIQGQVDEIVAYRMLERAFFDHYDKYLDSIEERIHILAAQDIIDNQN